MVLQNKFISSILRDDVQVKDASEGVNIIRERVCKYKVLVVLDDVGDRFDFGQILGKLSNFSSESRFIITTRDRRVLELHQESKVYEPKEMSHDHAIQLFNKHAFGMHDPLEGYATMCDEFVKVAAKLPLALKVIGSLLFRREKQFWEEKLIELKEIPATNNKVQQRLKISYNELTHNERQIFLDIACFFIGEDKDLPFHMWNGCNFYPESGVTTLIHRSLIKLDGNNRLWMHDLLRDLGRAIVFEEDIKHPSKRSRIWTNEDAVDMLINGEGTNHNQVEMLRVDMRHCGYFVLTGKEFKTMSGLRYLDVRHGALMGNFNRILPEMQWLKLYECSSIPTHMNLKQVAVLDLHKCEVTDDWRGWNEIQVAHKLKVINIYGCDELNRVPDLSQCRRLESVDLTYSSRMRGVLDISNFRNLKVVRFRETEITGLTGDMRKLQTLQEIETGKLVWTAEEVPVLPVSLKRLTIYSHKVPNLLELENL
ncbi:Disease resistance protein L6, partial [Linum perenne]